MASWFFDGNQLLVWPLVGLGIFILSFVLVGAYALSARRHEMDRMAALPLDDDVEVRERKGVQA
jgi:cbb3-type cytochrome oxidase subunit 3